ncbi:MerR family transcriptional regulator [Paradevosia shaoguanensis]|uniref:Helix-turn-helix domain-containing protein n=1 Tax=Paradevosia shaoguanensis TaxID=1335043 RepID=A0AA41QJL2_9HYPH|nr:helix-turn-helix domain-containing protein [Paradevosia shaoguanensis]MCF1740859.1 helix-turn-helix domain-containing protein [Paradevosia shaoguanensis]MCI0125343.1 helix-turn-helix domain-containing protein [Paradevosia shaoguanensis]
MRDYAIGELSSLSGVKVPTIRYYEEIGLLAVPPRTEGNQRRYDETALSRLRFIAHARAMGFPMDSLKAMLRISRHPEDPCDDIDDLVRGRLAEVEERIAKLTNLRSELQGMLTSHAHGKVAECRVMEVLSDHDNCRHEH